PNAHINIINFGSSSNDGWISSTPLVDGDILNLPDFTDSRSLLHELSHIYGTADTGEGLYNAHRFADIALGRAYNFGIIEHALWEQYSKDRSCMLPSPK